MYDVKESIVDDCIKICLKMDVLSRDVTCMSLLDVRELCAEKFTLKYVNEDSFVS